MSLRKISQICNVSRPKVSSFITLFKSSGFSYEEVKDLTEDSLNELFFPEISTKHEKNDRYAHLSSKFDYLLKEIKKTRTVM